MVYLIVQFGTDNPSVIPFDQEHKMREYCARRWGEGKTILPISENVFFVRFKEEK